MKKEKEREQKKDRGILIKCKEDTDGHRVYKEKQLQPTAYRIIYYISLPLLITK